MKHVPNALTAIRIVVTPLLIFLLFRDTLAGYSWALVLFVAATVSDYLDGKIARRFRVGTRLGQFLDPFADKVLVLGTFVSLAFIMPDQIPWWAIVLLAIRAIAVTGLRTWLNRQGRSLTTSRIAKAKTAVQLTFLIGVLVLLTASLMPANFAVPGIATYAQLILESNAIFWFLMVVVVVTVYTGAVYFMNLTLTKNAS